MSDYTPGPWFVSFSRDYFADGATVIRAKDVSSGVVVAVITKTPHEAYNASLLAAAPKLLACLKQVLECAQDDALHLHDQYVCDKRYDAARAAIAEAEDR